MKRSRHYMTPDDLNEATLFIKHGLSYAKAAKLWGVEPAWLWRQIRGRLS